MKDTYVVIPAFNEAKVIAEVIREVLLHRYTVVVVDDGSTDATTQMARDAGATVLVHPFNLGQGAALQTGLEFAARSGAAYVVTFDADGQHDASDIARMMEMMQRDQVDVILGSRFLGKTERLPWARKWLLKAAVIFTEFSSGLKLTDTHNGLRLLSARAVRQIKLRQNKMAHASEILDQIAAARLSFCEAPVTIRYSEYSLAKGQKISGMFAILSDIFYGKISR